MNIGLQLDKTGVYSAVGVWIVLFFEREKTNEQIYMIYGLKNYLLRPVEQAISLNFYTLNREKSLGETCPPRR